MTGLDDMEEYARTLIKLLRENPEVKAAVLNLIRSCPNVSMKY